MRLLLVLLAACSPAKVRIGDSGGIGTDDTASGGDSGCAPIPWYPDVDGDGFGATDGSPEEACDAPAGTADNAEDCDDGNGAIHPDADEYCDEVDNDCDGTIDEEALGAVTAYDDADGDGYGDDATAVVSCGELGSGQVTTGGDCDDAEDAIHPAATEVCDGADNDCDGTVDQDASDATTWYDDSDGDGYGATDTATTSCEQPGGSSTEGGDCDDSDVLANPGLDELCDDVDNDCDGEIDEGDAVDATVWHADRDGDGYGDATTTLASCSDPGGYVEDGTDCDDTSIAASPAQSETCDGIDNDCDGSVDEPGASGAETWYADVDGDGFGDADSPVEACEAPTGFVSDGTDCDDADASASPDGAEVCDDVDNDCDGGIDESAADASTWYADTDGDGHGDPGSTASACDRPTGYVSDASDCDDADASAYTGADEVCDDTDNDCDGSVDESATDAPTWYADDDTDGYGDAFTRATSCDRPAGYVSDASDCDDSDASTSPAEDEYCDGEDNDCDGSVDEDAVDADSWYLDADGDGYGLDTDSMVECDGPTGYVTTSGDCDDGDPAISPAATEICSAVDEDCDGYIDEGGVCGSACERVVEAGVTYQFCDWDASWTTARSTCNTYGYELVTIEDSTENDFLADTARTLLDDQWWIGFNDRTTEGSFAWDSGSSATYTDWHSGEPNDSGYWGEDCASLNRFGDSTWNDVSCSNTYPFICEAY